MRQGKFAQALDYLNRAAAEKGADSAKWQDLANKSQFYLKLDAAKDLARQSDWNGALAASEPLLSSSSGERAPALYSAREGAHAQSQHADYSFDSSFLEIGGGNASSEVAEQVKAKSQGQLPGIYRVDLSVDDRLVEQRDRYCKYHGQGNDSDRGSVKYCSCG